MTLLANAKRESMVLNVSLHEHEVGTLTKLVDDSVIFAFEDSFKSGSKPVFSLAYRSEDGGFHFAEKIYSTAKVPPVLSNLLPEGNLRDYIAKKVNVQKSREFFLIQAMGHDLPGGIVISSASGGYVDRTPNNSEPAPRASKGEIHFSLIGIQLKFSAFAQAEGGLTISADSEDQSWIIKCPSVHHDKLPESEFSMQQLAESVGITVPKRKLIPVSAITGFPPDLTIPAGNALAIERFDRAPNGGRIHMENFAQIFRVQTYPDQNAKYQNGNFSRIGKLILAECSNDDFEQYIKRLVFGVIFGNGDMHLKNWSILFEDGFTPSLSPAYDLVPAVAYLPDDNLGLKLGGSKSFSEIREINFQRLAKNVNFSDERIVEIVRETKNKSMDVWSKMKLELPMTPLVREAIEKHMKSLKL
jgi:serine/threonine-protein kinase HipA